MHRMHDPVHRYLPEASKLSKLTANRDPSIATV